LIGSIIADRAKNEKKGIGFDSVARDSGYTINFSPYSERSIANEVSVSVASYAYKMEWVDMIKAGIIDPAMVTRSAFQNAA